MAKRIVFSDEVNEPYEIQAYENDKGRCYIQCGDLNDFHNNGFVTLCKEDLIELIKELQSIAKNLPNG